MQTVENYIESQYRELLMYVNIEYLDLYESFNNQKLKEIFSTIHNLFVQNYKKMNSLLPSDDYQPHYWADNSRQLLLAINVLQGLNRVLKKTTNAFDVDPYYEQVISQSLTFLQDSGGSTVPKHMEKIVIYYTEPILRRKDSVIITSDNSQNRYADLKKIGEGSYADVYVFTDSFYHRKFVLKRAKDTLNGKELTRFKKEYEQMSLLSSPYIVEVYHFDWQKNEYIMEYVDYTLRDYIEKYSPSFEERKKLVYQFLQAFKYIHSKGIFHRDISPNNVLIKTYEDVKIVKISDFGLVKIPNSELTSMDTAIKGSYNDPSLNIEGFGNYNIHHEVYALTRLIAYTMTGRATADRITNSRLKAYVEKGLSTDKNMRYQSVDEMILAFREIK